MLGGPLNPSDDHGTEISTVPSEPWETAPAWTEEAPCQTLRSLLPLPKRVCSRYSHWATSATVVSAPPTRLASPEPLTPFVSIAIWIIGAPSPEETSSAASFTSA